MTKTMDGKEKRQRLKSAALNVIYPLAALALVLGIWAIAAKVKNKPLILPMPDRALRDFFQLFAQSGFWSSVGGTLWRTAVCFLIAFATAFLFAAAGGVFKPIAKILSPVVSILRAAPTMAVILIAMIWLNKESVPVLIGFLVAFPLLYQSIYTAIIGVDKNLVEMTKVYKVSAIDRVLHLYVPEIAPAVFDVSKSTLSLTLKVVIAAEVLAYTKSSIGLAMQGANSVPDISLLLAWTIMAIVMSFILEGIVSLLKVLWERRK